MPPLPPDPSLAERLIETISAALRSIKGRRRRDKDLFDSLNEAERTVRRNWPRSRPPGNGRSEFHRVMQIRITRLRWRAYLETVREVAWLVVAVAICLAFAWHQLLH